MTLRTVTLLLLVACGGGSDDSGTATGTTASADPTAACNTLCADAGFTDGTADVYDHEVNCFCNGTGGEVLQADCDATCSDLGWSNAEAFDVNACQCSDG